MPRLWLVGLLVLLVAGGWFFVNNYRVEGIDSLKIKSRTETAGTASGPGDPTKQQPPVPQGRRTIRVATINLGPFDQQKLDKPQVVERLASLIRRFDVVAIQDVRARDQSLLVRFVERVNADGRHYDFATSPRVGREPVEQYSAFLFDRATVQIDRRTVYLVQDEARRFRREPLAASFAARGPSAQEAFTFTLINVHVDPSQAAAELDLLDDVFRAVRDDGRGEDDVILLGDLAADEHHLGQLGEMPNIAWAIADVPSTTRGTRLVDNIVFDRRATSEFTSRSGVVDLIREFDLSMRQAVEISDHLPVWAEFSVFEGGEAGHVAADHQNAVR